MTKVNIDNESNRWLNSRRAVLSLHFHVNSLSIHNNWRVNKRMKPVMWPGPLSFMVQDGSYLVRKTLIQYNYKNYILICISVFLTSHSWKLTSIQINWTFYIDRTIPELYLWLSTETNNYWWNCFFFWWNINIIGITQNIFVMT